MNNIKNADISKVHNDININNIKIRYLKTDPKYIQNTYNNYQNLNE